jgi:hypothetical protein
MEFLYVCKIIDSGPEWRSCALYWHAGDNGHRMMVKEVKNAGII